MASLRRPSHLFGSKPDFSVPRPRAPRTGDTGRKRDARQSKVEEKMKTRRMSMRWVELERRLPGARARVRLGWLTADTPGQSSN